MKIKNLEVRPGLSERQRVQANDLQELINSLQDKNLSPEVHKEVNDKIQLLNSLGEGSVEYGKLIGTTKTKILNLLQKKLKIVPKNYYTSLWLSLGMSAFGLPIGLLIFTITGNIAFLAAGLPLGMGLGSFLGISLDRKAAAENRVILLKEQKT